MPEFQTWLDQQLEEARAGATRASRQQSFLARCTSCHQINGLENAEGEPIEVEAMPTRCPGTPPASHLMSRETFAGATFNLYDPDTVFNQSQVEAWLRNPPALKPMYTEPPEGEQPRGMPDLGLSETEIDQLVDYLMTLGPVPAHLTPTPTTDEAGS